MNLGSFSQGKHRKCQRGFTFVEVLAALLFLAVVIPTIVSALSLSNRASEMTERGAAAGELAENKLNEMLVNDAWQTAQATSGDCGPDWPGYRWQLTQTPWAADSAANMTDLKVEVFFKVQGVERSVALDTLVNTLATTSSTTTSSSLGGGNPTGTGTGGNTGRAPTGGSNTGGSGAGRPPSGGGPGKPTGGGGRP